MSASHHRAGPTSAPKGSRRPSGCSMPPCSSIRSTSRRDARGAGSRCGSRSGCRRGARSSDRRPDHGGRHAGSDGRRPPRRPPARRPCSGRPTSGRGSTPTSRRRARSGCRRPRPSPRPCRSGGSGRCRRRAAARRATRWCSGFSSAAGTAAVKVHSKLIGSTSFGASAEPHDPERLEHLVADRPGLEPLHVGRQPPARPHRPLLRAPAHARVGVEHAAVRVLAHPEAELDRAVLAAPPSRRPSRSTTGPTAPPCANVSVIWWWNVSSAGTSGPSVVMRVLCPRLIGHGAGCGGGVARRAGRGGHRRGRRHRPRHRRRAGRVRRPGGDLGARRGARAARRPTRSAAWPAPPTCATRTRSTPRSPRTIDALGTPTILVNNAGGTFHVAAARHRAEGLGRADPRPTSRTCCCARSGSAGRWSPPGTGGSIVNITSIEGTRAAPGYAAYARRQGRRRQPHEDRRAGAGPARDPRELPRPRRHDDRGPHGDRPARLRGAASPTWCRWAGPATSTRWPAPRCSCASALSSYVTGQTIHVDGGTAAAGGWYHHPDDGHYVLGSG